MHRTTKSVILSEVRSTKSKDLRIIVMVQQQIGAKILRLATLAQDDMLGRLPAKLQFTPRRKKPQPFGCGFLIRFCG